MQKIYGIIVGILYFSGVAYADNQTDAYRYILLKDEARLKACLALIATDPEQAYEESLNWLYQGQRPLARYCNAQALIALDHFDEGAARLESLAYAPDGGDNKNRARYLAIAGNTWILAGHPAYAINCFNGVMKFIQPTPLQYKDRARAYLLDFQWHAAEKDLDKAIALSQNDGIAYFMRAEARLNRKAFDLALQDITKARTYEPENIDILVLRGRIIEAKRLKKAR